MTPSLRNLSLIGFDDHPPELFEDIQCAAPALTQLTLKPMQYKRPLFDDLASIVGGDNLSRKRPSRRCTQDHSSSPNSITHTSSTWPPNYSVTDTPSGTSSPAPQPCPCSVSGNLLKHVKTINVQRSSAKPLRHSEHLCIPDKQLQALACRDSRLKILQPVKICPYNETKREWLKSQCMYF
ncbi:hypothetical protein AX16_006560 [Volvariella volvacea WC 439]|nr:hypothetical protein AX16_006560 [Volvariella volvacea WC 439]